jgi:tetratricopeptide (TPR) repeat protein
MELQLYNYFPLSAFAKSGGEFWFPIGTRILLKEPYLTSRLQLRVDNMQNIKTSRPFNISTGQELKAQGNQAFKEEQYSAACWLYRLALDVTPVIDVLTREALFANRAAALLRLGDFREAIADCDQALSLNAGNFKASYRKAQAMMGIESYTEALALLKQLLLQEKRSPSTITDLENKIEIVTVSIAQKTGVFDFMTLPFHPDKQSDTASYLGPLEIQSAGAYGRGLYLTRDVQKGELLLVEDPIAFNYKSCESAAISSTVSGAAAGDEDHYGTLVDLVYMACRDRQKNALLSVLSSEKESIDFLPDIKDVYSRHLLEDVAPLSAHTINGICLINCFCMEITSHPTLPIREAVCRSVDMMKSKVGTVYVLHMCCHMCCYAQVNVLLLV